ncbi:mannose-1-phosphate guanylyltransferase/mannose-6-phosphate isomerase [Bdellovibrio sp. HCB337]|uniref:mannose-1-phosphate guanylyltransferase/mannose-6-phosphate isomerase n=1 Tax=Bdellovibrio sp. HCB337 TaxID=3394358 RepID=UPI0039A50058
MIPVILSGGSGTRLWPVSRANFPKQFCDLFDDSLQSLTLKRCQGLGPLWIVTGSGLKTLTEANLKELNLQNVSTIYEPVAKNTAPAVAVLAQVLVTRGLGEEVVGVFPSDHLIQNKESFYQAVRSAEKLAQNGAIVTLGIKPDHPATGYGYIQKDKASNKVLKFHEKPSLETAEKFLASGDFFWNAGMFIFKAKVMLEKFQKLQPDIYKIASQLKADLSNLDEVYAQFPNISIDYAIMEKLSSDELSCVPADMAWSDVGSWDAVVDVVDGQGSDGPLEIKGKHNFVFGREGKMYSFVGTEDLILVDTADAMMVVKKGQSQEVKQVVEVLQKQGSSLTKDHVFEKRPWGAFEILRDTDHFKSKVITVNPRSQISYQSHSKRAEHWIITRGQGEVVLNDQVIPVKAGSHVFIPIGAKHRIRNTSDEMIEFVEVQLGTYFGEDDIVRYQDDYKRT